MFGDANLTGYMSLDFFPNNWQTPLLGLLSVNASKESLSAASAAELFMFGMAPFAQPSHAPQTEGWPASLTEATERPVCTWLNAWKVNQFSMYGGVALVFRSSAVQGGTFLA